MMSLLPWEREERKRSEILAVALLDGNRTIRQVASEYGVSKSTVHKDLTQKLPHENKELYRRVKTLLERNKAERHLRGGEATRLKYRQKKEAGKAPKS